MATGHEDSDALHVANRDGVAVTMSIEETRDSRKRDPEILQLERIARIIDELSVLARARVVAYLADRYRPVDVPF